MAMPLGCAASLRLAGKRASMIWVYDPLGSFVAIKARQVGDLRSQEPGSRQVGDLPRIRAA